jgi:hypothetical protein
MSTFITKTFVVVSVAVSSFLGGVKDAVIKNDPTVKTIKQDKKEVVEKKVSQKTAVKTATTTESKVSPKSSQKKSNTNIQKVGQEVVKKTQVVVETKKVVSSENIENQNVNVPVVSAVDFGLINESTRKALVNIICSNTKSGALSPITGSGVLVSADGVILTNAHIAQYFLLKDFNGEKGYLDCVIRVGSPAYATYRAKLVYISPDWILNNKTILVDKNPVGTGEFDYAFLKITERIDQSPLSNTAFVNISLNENIAVGSTTLLASYPAGFLGGISVLQGLYQTSAITSISNIYTFATNTIDLISVGGTVVSQKGSSGGAVVDETNSLIGVISTSGSSDTTSQRDLRAVTLAYIERDLKRKTGSGIETLVKNADSVSEVFLQNIAPSLEKILTDVVLGR